MLRQLGAETRDFDGFRENMAWKYSWRFYDAHIEHTDMKNNVQVRDALERFQTKGKHIVLWKTLVRDANTFAETVVSDFEVRLRHFGRTA